jgi:tetratricopeptide (TPR) repeat protein
VISIRYPRALAAALLLGAAVLTAPNIAGAIDTRSPSPPPAPSATGTPPPAASTAPTGTVTPKKRQRQQHPTAAQPQKNSSSQEFLRGYHVAYDLVYKKHDYEAGITQLRSLGHDEHSDVATTIGYASRKLGRYDDAKYWYDKALASDPNNARTLSYYGMWHAEQGNVLKARDYLAKVETICGNTTCREYAALKNVIDGAGTY